MLLLVLFGLILVVPVVELVVILKVAGGIGVPETIALLIIVSAVGAWLCKREGLGVLRRIQKAVERGEMPTRQLVDAGLILFAGALLITPGFLSDLVGILLLLPPTRAVFRTALMAAIGRRVRVTTITTARNLRGYIDTSGSERP